MVVCKAATGTNISLCKPLSSPTLHALGARASIVQQIPRPLHTHCLSQHTFTASKSTLTASKSSPTFSTSLYGPLNHSDSFCKHLHGLYEHNRTLPTRTLTASTSTLTASTSTFMSSTSTLTALNQNHCNGLYKHTFGNTAFTTL